MMNGSPPPRPAKLDPLRRRRRPALEVRHPGFRRPRAEPGEGHQLSVKSGEVLGVAGISSSGQAELPEAIMGIRRPIADNPLHGEDISGLSIRERHARGLAFVPGDRHRDGLIGPMSVADNLALSANAQPATSRLGILYLKSIDARARSLMKRFGISAAGPAVRAATLSGGNQQKLILARELARNPGRSVLLPDTRIGLRLDRAVHEEVRLAAARGASVVGSRSISWTSALTARLIVLQAGRITGEKSRPDQVTRPSLV
jgi:simple sugar transport system ATP-binding protein